MELLSREKFAEARLDDRTLEGKIDHSITELPHRIAKTIQK